MKEVEISGYIFKRESRHRISITNPEGKTWQMRDSGLEDEFSRFVAGFVNAVLKD